jgi:hypothetical protein
MILHKSGAVGLVRGTLVELTTPAMFQSLLI